MANFNAPEDFYAPKVSNLHDIRLLLTKNELSLAEKQLESVENSCRDAEWNFLMGNVLYKRKHFNEAYIYFNLAANMDTNNNEYFAALQQLTRQNNAKTSFFSSFFGKK